VGVTTLLSHVALPGPKMRPAWNRAHVGEIWGYGKWIMGSSLAGFFVQQGDRLVFAALLDARVFGLYAIAMIWVETLAGTGKSLSRQIGQPVLNEIRRTRPWDFAAAFGRLRRANDLLFGALFAATILIAHLLIDFIYDPRYAEVERIIVVMGFVPLTCRYAVLTSLASAFGEGRGLFAANLMALPGVFLTIPLAYAAFGPTAAFCAAAFVPLWTAPRLLEIARRHVALDMRREMALLAALPVFGVLWAYLIGPALLGLPPQP
jgi:O-antigen/teichoic acid export membrane protein